MNKLNLVFLLRAFLLGCTALVAAGAAPADKVGVGWRYALTFLFALFTVAVFTMLA